MEAVVALLVLSGLCTMLVLTQFIMDFFRS